ncbi:MAG TPA: hypothetical protein VJ812_10150 [Gemmatimonadaceae bacterium]|nr:hypothetical protein [Gemmatimonadaceae bacterium]
MARPAGSIVPVDAIRPSRTRMSIGGVNVPLAGSNTRTFESSRPPLSGGAVVGDR